MIVFYENRNKCHKTSLKYHSGVILINLKSIALELWELSLDRVKAIPRHLKSIALKPWELSLDNVIAIIPKVIALFLKIRAMLLKIKTNVD